MAEPGSNKKEPGIYTERVGTVPVGEMDRKSLEELAKMPGVVVEADADKREVIVTLNSIVLPEKK